MLLCLNRSLHPAPPPLRAFSLPPPGETYWEPPLPDPTTIQDDLEPEEDDTDVEAILGALPPEVAARAAAASTREPSDLSATGVAPIGAPMSGAGGANARSAPVQKPPPSAKALGGSFGGGGAGMYGGGAGGGFSMPSKSITSGGGSMYDGSVDSAQQQQLQQQQQLVESLHLENPPYKDYLINLK